MGFSTVFSMGFCGVFFCRGKKGGSLFGKVDKKCLGSWQKSWKGIGINKLQSTNCLERFLCVCVFLWNLMY